MSRAVAGDEVGEQPALFVSAEMDDVEVWAVAGGTAVVFSAPAPDRDQNQDAAAVVRIDDDTALLAVADGVGGERGGARAAELAVTTLALSVTRRQANASLRGAVLDGFEAANRAVRDSAGSGMTTLAALTVERRSVRPYHVGDSAVLLFGQRGRLKLQTVSHSPVGFALEAGILDEEEAMHHADRHVVSNVLGSPDMRIEIGAARRLAPHDTAVVASDGLFDNMHTEEIVEMARTGTPSEAASRLVDTARRRMQQDGADRPSKPDDLTLVLFRPSRG
ncbi:MAG: serine/threonine-protein phosphatase [Deltaproteobacteria bacterium]|nr:serine/threonine-protein phosphatase [Deltaproteobacteria bacterium]MBW2360455.1 serine/threonine-protein phosphatase [Deltaproteobacteria bacterium]